MTAATEAVTVDAETLQHEQALLYCTASEHWGLTYVGTVFLDKTKFDTICEALFFNNEPTETTWVVWAVAGSWGGAVVTLTVTAESYAVTHVVLRV